MAVVTPPQITPPPPKPQRGDKATFRERVDDFITWMIAVVAQFAALASNVFSNAQDAAGSAGAANSSAGQAQGYRNEASGFRNSAESHRNEALGFRNEAEGFKNAAAQSAAALRGTSVNALTIGVGSKSLTVETGRQFEPGVTLKLVVVGNGEAWMSGRVTSYNSATGALVVNVLAVASAYAGQSSNTWNLYVAGEVGPTGPQGSLSGGTLTGALNERQATTIPVSSTPDIWSGAGNLVGFTGTGTITGFTNAPQAGARRTLLFTDTATLTFGAKLIVYGGTITLTAGDIVEVIAEGGTDIFRCIVFKRDGTPVAHDRGALHNLRVFGGSGVFTAPKTGWYKITVIGSSGSGGAAVSGLTGHAGASGAGAGGFVSGMRYLTAGVNYTVGVFGGGAAVTASSSSYIAVNGNAGGNNFFSGSGITTMTANGGGGGRASIDPGAEIAGGVGGTATGAAGDMIVQGGNGGAVSALAANSPAASGGGAVGLRGQPYRGGDASSNGGFAAAGGGAGVGGRGGDATSTTNTALAGGGGCADTAMSVTNTLASTAQAGANFQGTPGGGASYPMPNDLESATGGGGWSNTAGFSGGGGGGANSLTAPGDGGLFAGGGGSALRSSNGSGLPAAKGGGYGGAPGGVAQINSSSTGNIIATGQPGRSGGVWIEW